MYQAPVVGRNTRRLDLDAAIVVFVVSEAPLYAHGSPTLARDLPCDAELAPSWHQFSHDVCIMSDVGKHCYVSPRFVRRLTGSPKVPSSRRRLAHTPPGTPRLESSEGTAWRARLDCYLD